MKRRKVRFTQLQKPTVASNLSRLVREGKIKIKGIGRSTIYMSFQDNPVLRSFDLDQYFSLEPDERGSARRNCDFSIFSRLKDLFTREEVQNIEKQN